MSAALAARGAAPSGRVLLGVAATAAVTAGGRALWLRGAARRFAGLRGPRFGRPSAGATGRGGAAS
jgi:hypothetical protein